MCTRGGNWEEDNQVRSIPPPISYSGKRPTYRSMGRYVEYSMHRVRLLRHHKITPYIVFDGGPLPAKKATESERKKRRDENLALANKLAAVGKHAQAREYYVKCVDVTTEMAYQFIKVALEYLRLSVLTRSPASGRHCVQRAYSMS